MFECCGSVVVVVTVVVPVVPVVSVVPVLSECLNAAAVLLSLWLLQF